MNVAEWRPFYSFWDIGAMKLRHRVLDVCLRRCQWKFARQSPKIRRVILFLRSCYTVVARMFRWSGTGGAMGALCGMPISISTCLITWFSYVLIIVFTGFGALSVIQIAMFLFLPILLVVLVGLLIGQILGFIVGAVIFAVMSLIEWRHDLPMWTSEYENTMMRWSVRASLIGSVSCASSFTFLYYLAQRDFHPYFALAVFILGAFGGFAVGLFLGARSIIRENAARESSTR